MRVLFLDDCPHRTRTLRSELPFAKCVSTADAIIEQLQRDVWDVLFLDHDLGGEAYVDSERADTGMEVVRWLTTNKTAISKIIVHSHNDIAAPAMAENLVAAGYDAKSVPFAYLKQLGILDAIAEKHRADLSGPGEDNPL